MKRRLISTLMIVIMAAGLFALLSQKAQATQDPWDKIPQNAWDLMPVINVGWNLGNSLENQDLTRGFVPVEDFASLETRLRNPVTTKEVIDAVAAAGFSCIRIPVSFYNHLVESKPAVNGVPQPGETIDENWLIRIRQVVDWAYANHLYVIIDNHHDTSMWGTMSWIHADVDTYATDSVYYEKLWRQVATYFAEYDHHLIFQSTGEIVNAKENTSHGDLRFTAYESYRDFQVAHDYNQLFIETVRETGGNNADRFLILETYAANAEPVFVDQCFYEPYEDTCTANRLIFGVHCYHADPEELRAVFRGLAQKSVQYGMPFIVDECGTQYDLDQATRVEVARTLSVESARYGAAVVIWDDGLGAFGLMDREATIAKKEPVAFESLPWDDTYELWSADIVNALVYPKNSVTPMTREELRALYDTRFQVTDFTGLHAGNEDILRAGQYAQTHEAAANPVSEYIPTPANYAAIYPYVYAEGAHFMATLPRGVKVSVREHDRYGHYIKTVTVENGGYYLPSEQAAYLGIFLRIEDKTVRLSDYEDAVNAGALLLSQAGYDVSAYSVTLKDAVRQRNGSVLVTWESLDGADGYRVMRREKDGAIWTPVGELLDREATSFADYGATQGVTYDYTVRPYFNRRESGMSFRLFGGYDHAGVRSSD